MAPRRRPPAILLGAALVLVLAVGVGVGVVATRGPMAVVVDESVGQAGRKTIEYEDVRVDLPGSWERVDREGCDFQFETWGPAGQGRCENDAAGVSFYASATFDPALGPGVRSTDAAGPDAAAWAGYVYAGELAVYAADDDRAVVQGILDSVR